MSNEPIPFRSREQRDAIRKGVETRAKRLQLLALAQKQPSFELWTAADLEKIFWDVDEWARTIPEHHLNAPLVYDLQEHIAAEYTRRHQEDPWMTQQQRAANHLEQWIKGQTAPAAQPPRLTLVPKNDEPDPVS